MATIKTGWRFYVRRINPKMDQEYGNFDLPPGASMSKLTLMKQLSYCPDSISKLYPVQSRSVPCTVRKYTGYNFATLRFSWPAESGGWKTEP